MSEQTIKGMVVGCYFLVVLIIGWLAFKRSQHTLEDYFLGGRKARTVVLFMALFGTNITPFALMATPGLAYHQGIGVFGYNAAIAVIGIPITFWLIGYPAWKAARRLGAITPAELFSRRLHSPLLGQIMFLVFMIYTLPYMVTAVSGVGLAFEVLSENSLDFDSAAAGILLVTAVYTALGGMRATMWTNVFQGSMFLLFILTAFTLIASDLGGPVEATDRVRVIAPELLARQRIPAFEPGAWTSWSIIMAMTVIAFPHMLVRVFAAKDGAALKNACRTYPLAMVLLWGPVVMIGIWGAAEFPDLVGKESERILPLMVQAHLGPVLQGLALASILAAVMSTLDAQLLTLSSMLTRDVLRKLMPGLGERRELLCGRVFLALLMLAVYMIVISKPASIFELARLSFSGYVTLVPTMFLTFHWRRFDAKAAIASILVGNACLVLAVNDLLPSIGLMPGAWGFVAAALVALLASIRR